MNPFLSLFTYLLVGAFGGYLGAKIKLPAGTLVGAMLAVVAFKILSQRSWSIPTGYGFLVQVLVGVTVGCTFHPDMLKTFTKIGVPLISSTVVLVLTGIALSVVFARVGLMDISTAYLSTSPGAMSAIVWLALDHQSDAPVVVSFHFFRVVFVILTAPLILKYLMR